MKLMKLRYFITFFIAVVAVLFSSCSEDEATYLDEIRVSKSIIAIPASGGSDTITLKAVDEWTIDSVYSSDGTKKYSWLNVSVVQGQAGETQVIFSADSSTVSNEATLYVSCAGQKQMLSVIQVVSSEVEEATCADVIAGPESKSYRVSGVCTKIANTVYGNWYLEDNTGSVYIYGTLDKNGATKNFESLGIEVGDEVVVEGPKTVYKGTVELVDVTVIDIIKSLVKVDSVSAETVGVDGGELVVYLTCKGNGVNVEIPEEAESWLSIKSVTNAGTNAVVKFNVAANTGGDRNVNLVFKTNDGTKDYSSEITVSQLGAIIEATIAQFNAAAVGETQYRITGVVTKVANTKYGNVYVKDFSGETYIYGINDFADSGIKEGDIVTLVGKRSEYTNSKTGEVTIQMKNATAEKVISVESVTVTEFLSKEDSEDKYYMVTGVITEVKNSTYGNIYISDGENTLYVYGCYPGYGATGDDRKNFLANAGLSVGDTVTMIGYKTTYKETIELCGGICFNTVIAEKESSETSSAKRR